jgi:hypothetical protein
MAILAVDVNQYCIYGTTFLEPSTPHAMKQILEVIPLSLLPQPADDHNKDGRVRVHPFLLHRGEESQGALHVAHSAVPSNQSVPSGNIRPDPFRPHFVEQPARVGQLPALAEGVDQAVVDRDVELHPELLHLHDEVGGLPPHAVVPVEPHQRAVPGGVEADPAAPHLAEDPPRVVEAPRPRVRAQQERVGAPGPRDAVVGHLEEEAVGEAEAGSREQPLEERVVVRGVRARPEAAHLEQERLSLERAAGAAERADKALVRGRTGARPRRLHVGEEVQGAGRVGAGVGLDAAVVGPPRPLLVLVRGCRMAANHGAGDTEGVASAWAESSRTVEGKVERGWQMAADEVVGVHGARARSLAVAGICRRWMWNRCGLQVQTTPENVFGVNPPLKQRGVTRPFQKRFW